MAYNNEKLIEFNKYLQNRKVAVIGLGVSNIPLIDYLHKQKSIVTVFDKRNIDDIPKEVMDKVTDYGMEFSLGNNYLSKLTGFDLIFRSPSCLPTTPELRAEEERGAGTTHTQDAGFFYSGSPFTCGDDGVICNRTGCQQRVKSFLVDRSCSSFFSQGSRNRSQCQYKHQNQGNQLFHINCPSFFFVFFFRNEKSPVVF